MNYFHGELKAGEMVKVPLSSSIATISNMGDNELSVNFDSEEPGLIIPKKMGRTFNLNGYVEYLYLLSKLGTTVQVDAFAGGYFMTSPVTTAADGEVPVIPEEPTGDKLKVSLYFPLPTSGEYENWAVVHRGVIDVRHYNGNMVDKVYRKEATTEGYGIDVNNGYDYGTYSHDNPYSSAGINNDEHLVATNAPIYNESGKVIRDITVYGTWKDNANIEGFYPRRYLGMKPRGYDGWVLIKDPSNDETILVYYKGVLEYNKLSSEIYATMEGYELFSWNEETGYTKTEEDELGEVTFIIPTENILESYGDINDTAGQLIFNRTLLREFTTEELEKGVLK